VLAIECVGKKKHFDGEFTNVMFFWEIRMLAISMLGEFPPVKF
jgi:hypothetical protein